MIKIIAKKILPKFFLNQVLVLVTNYKIRKVERIHKHAVINVSKKEKIKVAFILVYESMWKYENLYFLLKDNERFEPIVFICPFRT